MTRMPWHVHATNQRKRRPRRLRPLLVGITPLAIAVIVLAWRGARDAPPERPGTRLVATPSAALGEAVRGERRPFARAVAEAAMQRGYVTVTVHVALADHRTSDVSAEFGDGENPTTNLCWGALFGMETHTANAAGWRRAYTDDGADGRIIRRVVFHRRAEVAPPWRSRGVERPFDVYVLACAWPSSQTAAAMEQPLRDALLGEPVVLSVDGLDVAFGGGSVMTGYLGPNGLLDRPRDLFAGLPPRTAGPQRGVFYACPISAVYLHQPAVEHGLYSVLFARLPIVTEAYIVDGILDALITGNLDDGFVAAAADRYAHYQNGITSGGASLLFFR